VLLAFHELEFCLIFVSKRLLIIGHYLRGLVILDKGQEAENAFARVAIMPLIRSQLSMGRLDQGGSRGECTGLSSLLQDILDSISLTFGPVLRLSENIFDREIDLVTAGVWLPIATALMTDAGVKMAIFSPGIASILQQNYLALDNFLSSLALRLLSPNDASKINNVGPLSHYYYHPEISPKAIVRVQDRLYRHPKTAEFLKKWNLPIYYQLRFGDCCSRLNIAVDKTIKEGWISNVFSGDEDELLKLRLDHGFEISFFVEVYSILSSFWKEDVFLRPLTHRFLRGVVQIVGRVLAFLEEGLEGKIKFGEEKQEISEGNGLSEVQADDILSGRFEKSASAIRDPYVWGEVLEDVATVSWDLTVLESKLSNDYLKMVTSAAVASNLSDGEKDEMTGLIKSILDEGSSKVTPFVSKAWNSIVVNLLIRKCSEPLAAVKGVAATYRMTNRPAPTQPSPFVPTILRPLIQFNEEFRRKTPPAVGSNWKMSIVSTIAERYSAAVEELISTIQRTEVALQSRRARRTVAGGMSDGEKAKLQLYLDFKEFVKSVELLGIDPNAINGVMMLQKLTQEISNVEG
jgi:conserved oligomeric Golgi complex subunit 2